MYIVVLIIEGCLVLNKKISFSADVNFAADLSDLRHRKKYDVVLIHSRRVSEALKICATKSILYEELVKDLPKRQAEVVSFF